MFEFRLQLDNAVEAALFDLGLWARQERENQRRLAKNAQLRTETDLPLGLAEFPQEWREYSVDAAEISLSPETHEALTEVVYDPVTRRRYLAWEREVLETVSFRSGWAEWAVGRQKSYLERVTLLFDAGTFAPWIQEHAQTLEMGSRPTEHVYLDFESELPRAYNEMGDYQLPVGDTEIPPAVDVSGALVATANLITGMIPATHDLAANVSWALGAALAGRKCIDAICRRNHIDVSELGECLSVAVGSLLGLAPDV